MSEPFRAVKDLVERDGRFRLVKMGRFYADPEEDWRMGRAPIFGAVLKEIYPHWDRSPMVLVVPIAEDFADAAGPEVLSRMLLERAEAVAANAGHMEVER